MSKQPLAIALVATALCLASFAAPTPGVADEAGFVVATADQQAALAGDPFQALVTRIVKHVEWERARTHLWQLASINNLLLVGDTLRTGTGATAELLYGDGSVTRVGSLSSLTLAGSDHRELHLDSGRVWLHIMKHNAGMRVITPGAVAAVTGTELMVAFDPVKKLTEVTVFEGAVNVTGDVGNLVRVTGGTTTRVLPHAPAAAPAPLTPGKVQERENILRPLSIDSSKATPDASLPTVSGTAAPTAPQPTGGPLTSSTATSKPTEPVMPNAVPTSATAVATAAPAAPVQPDLKAQTKPLIDPRVINGSPTSARVRVIIQ